MTVVRREPKWTEEDRARAIELDEVENSKCGCGCGQPIDVAFDDERVFTVDSAVCQAQRAIRVKEQQDRELAEKQNRPASWAYGRRWFIKSSRSLTDDELAKRQKRKRR